MNEPAPPRPASTIMLLRDGPAGLEAFMVVRHHQIDFASGALVFPGGRMEATDAELAGSLFGVDPLAPFKVAAIREAFEECGVLMARPPGEDGLVPPGRVENLDRAAPFAELLARENLAPAIDCLVPFAHWITPAFLPKRFDTHFFLALAPAGHALAHDGREAVEFGLDLSARGLGGARPAVQAPLPNRAEPLEALGSRRRRFGAGLRARRADRDRAARAGRGRRRPRLKNSRRGRLRRRSFFGSRAALSPNAPKLL